MGWMDDGWIDAVLCCVVFVALLLDGDGFCHLNHIIIAEHDMTSSSLSFYQSSLR